MKGENNEIMKNKVLKKLLMITLIFSKYTYSATRIGDYLEKKEQIKNIEKELNRKELEEVSLRDINKIEDNSPTYIFSNITVIGNTMLDIEISKVIKNYKNRSISVNDIKNLENELTNIYLKRGYITSYAEVLEGNIVSGTLVFKIIEGKVNVVDPTDIKIRSAFPSKKNDILNIYNIDQALDNLNLTNFDTQVYINQSENQEYSDIYFNVEKNNPQLRLEVNNSNYKDNGKYMVSTFADIPNLLEINDMLRVNYTERMTKKVKDREFFYNINYSIPYKYWKFTYNHNLEERRNKIKTNFNVLKTITKMEKNYFKIEKNIYRNRRKKINLYSGVELVESFSSLNSTKIDVSSKKYTNFRLGLDYLHLEKSNLYFNFEYIKGVPWFEGEKNNDLSPYNYEYDRYDLNIYWQKNFNLAQKLSFIYNLNIGGSYSEDRLLSFNQFTIGDEYTVRGFKEYSASGNKGIYMNNTLIYTDLYKVNEKLSYIYPFIGMDFGMSRDKDLPNSDKLVGMAIGIKIESNNVSSSLTYGIPLKTSSGILKEKNPIYFSFSYKL